MFSKGALQGAKMRILIVEDEPALSEQLARRSATAGYAVDLAADGERADFLARTESYDAVLLDLGLPHVDGLTLLRGWRDSGTARAGPRPDRARQLARKGARHRRRRRRLRRQAVSDGRSARPAARR